MVRESITQAATVIVVLSIGDLRYLFVIFATSCLYRVGVKQRKGKSRIEAG
jgi:hypothetical protein